MNGVYAIERDTSVRALRARVGSIAADLAALASALGRFEQQIGEADATDRHDANPSDQQLIALARRMIARRAARSRHFPSGLFADPAWDMLLDLFIARLQGSVICVSSLCIASGVPSTTALRWIATLENEGVLTRRPDPADRRRSLVELSDMGVAAMRSTLLTTPVVRCANRSAALR